MNRSKSQKKIIILELAAVFKGPNFDNMCDVIVLLQ